MDPDDAADLIAELPPETAEALLQLMEPDEAEDVKRLMSYVEDTAGAMMTSEPVILGPDATIADALAHVRDPDLTPAAGRARLRLPAAAGDARPAGFLGVAHIQRLLREPPSTLVAGALDDSMENLRPEADDRRGRGPPRDVQPGRRAGRRRDRAPARRGHRRRPARPHAAGELARPGRSAVGWPAPVAEPAAPRRSTPRARPAGPLVRRPTYDDDMFGVFAEQFARFMGTARFLIYMTAFVAIWVLWNSLAPEDLRWDDYPFIFLTLMLSLQASYAAPLILLAQNRQEHRDKVIAEQDRQANARAHADMEFLAREVASLRMAVGEVATRDYLRSELRALLAELERSGARTGRRRRPARPTPRLRWPIMSTPPRAG